MSHFTGATENSILVAGPSADRFLWLKISNGAVTESKFMRDAALAGVTAGAKIMSLEMSSISTAYALYSYDYFTSRVHLANIDLLAPLPSVNY
jgi:hypothetical protein